VCGGVAEAGNLLVLRAQVRQRVVDEVDQRELARHACRGHVAEPDGERFGVDLGAQHRDHRLGELDTAHRHASGRERNPDATGTYRKLERGAAVGQPREEIDRGAEHPGREHVGRVVVVGLCGLVVPDVAARHDPRA